MDIAEVEVTSLTPEGLGVAAHEGAALRVPCVLPGERVRVALPGAQGRQSAELLEVIVTSPERVPPPCRHFGECGGCLLQHMRGESYAAFKRARLAQALMQAGFAQKVEPELVAIPAASRRRAEFKISGRTLGYYARESHDVVDVESCAVLAPPLQAALTKLREALPQGLPLVSLHLAHFSNGLDAVACMKHPPAAVQRELLAKLAADMGLLRLSCRVGDGAVSLIARHAPVFAQCSNVQVEAPPGAFQQASKEGEEAILREVTAALAGCRSVADLFCGLGTYAFALAAAGASVTAAEGEAAMVQSLAKAARAAGLAGRVKAETRDLFRQPLKADALCAFDGVVVNPPRSGAAAQCKEIVAAGVPCVVMVSCNPVTFARDAAYFKKAGYRLARVVAIDQFVWSQHLETVAVFRL